jgi:nitrogen regulatory protein P-II 1
MRQIKAIIRPFQLADVVTALQDIPDLPGITVFDVRGFGRQHADQTRDSIEDESIRYVTKVQLELVVPDRLADSVIFAIREHACTGNPGDGKIFSSPVDDAMRIRTGERGESAL